MLEISKTLLAASLSAMVALAQVPLYNPIPLPAGYQIKDTLSDKDIPTGQAGFARDYLIHLKAGEQVIIELNSNSFDTLVSLMEANGIKVKENDDSSAGITNSRLSVQITKTGAYIIRVTAFGATRGGPFTLKLKRLRRGSQAG